MLYECLSLRGVLVCEAYIAPGYVVFEVSRHSRPVHGVSGPSQAPFYTNMCCMALCHHFCPECCRYHHLLTSKDKLVLYRHLLSKRKVGMGGLWRLGFRLRPTLPNDLADILHGYILSRCSLQPL